MISQIIHYKNFDCYVDMLSDLNTMIYNVSDVNAVPKMLSMQLQGRGVQLNK